MKTNRGGRDPGSPASAHLEIPEGRDIRLAGWNVRLAMTFTANAFGFPQSLSLLRKTTYGGKTSAYPYFPQKAVTETATDDAIRDKELLALAAKGDRAAFGQIYDRYSKPLFSLAMRMLGESSEAEDVIQDVFIAIWNNAGSFDPNRAKLFTWAVTLTRNKAIDRLRTRKRRASIIERSSEDIADFSLSAGSPDSVEVAGRNERAGIVRKAFRMLPSEQRKPIELAYFKGMTQVEIAERLGEPLGTIKARIRRGLLRLRDGLEGQV